MSRRARAREIWHAQPGDLTIGAAGNLMLAGDYLVYRAQCARRARRRRARRAAGPAGRSQPPPVTDEWDRYHSLNLASPDAKPVLLTTTDGLIEDQTSVALSRDGKTLYYCTNATGHRAAPHLGRAGGRRHAGAGHDRRRHRNPPGPARVGHAARHLQRRLEDAAVARHLDAGRRRRRPRRRSCSRRRGRTSRPICTSSRS